VLGCLGTGLYSLIIAGFWSRYNPSRPDDGRTAGIPGRKSTVEHDSSPVYALASPLAILPFTALGRGERSLRQRLLKV